MFLANYGDVLTDAPIDRHDRAVPGTDTVGAASSRSRRSYTFHVVDIADGRPGRASLTTSPTSDMWINGGYFVFRREIFDYIEPGEELVEEPFRRLIAEDQLMTLPARGFWAPMDTLKEEQDLEELLESGRAALGAVGAERRHGEGTRRRSTTS